MKWLMLVLVIVQADGKGISRTSGGSAAKPGQFPHLVFIVASKLSVLYCSGSILTPTWVLTAAHCVLVPELTTPLQASSIKVYAGILDFYEIRESMQNVTGKKYVVHPDYHLFNATNNTDLGSYDDIALIETATPFSLNQLVNTVNLPRTPATHGSVRCAIAGFGDSEWGSTKLLKYIRVMQINTCANVDHQELQSLYQSDKYLCCFSRPGSFTMPGDSGAPLQCGKVVVGINFWVKPLYGNIHIMIVLEVFPYLDWIYTHIPQLATSPYPN